MTESLSNFDFQARREILQENLTDAVSNFDFQARREILEENLTKSVSDFDFQARSSGGFRGVGVVHVHH